MKTIGVFFGGKSPEHDVSIITGQLIISTLKKIGYDIIPVYIDKKGQWYVGKELSDLKIFTQNRLGNFQKLTHVLVDLKESQGKMVLRKKGLLSEKIVIDCAFPAFHGRNGEDGTFQGLCEILDIPYVGCDTTSSAITMDKVLTKLLYKAYEIKTTPFIYFTKIDWLENKTELLKKIQKNLKMPLIVKPSRLGSSIGIGKAKTQKELEFSIEVALYYDEKVIVEECIVNLMDITCALLGNDKPTASLLQESIFENDFFSYADKYLNEGGAQLGNAAQNIIIPARLDNKTTKEIRETALSIFKAFGCSGIARVDFLYDKKRKQFFANEINTLPGTLYHHLWKASGIELTEVVQRLVNYAQETYDNQKKYITTFESNLLSQANSVKLQLKK